MPIPPEVREYRSLTKANDDEWTHDKLVVACQVCKRHYAVSSEDAEVWARAHWRTHADPT